MFGASNQLPHDYSCPQAVRTAIPSELYSTAYIAERAKSYLASRADNEKPFFLMVSFPDPHHPFNPPGKYWDMYKPEDMDIPLGFRGEKWSPPFHVQAILDQRQAGKANLAGMGTIGIDVHEALEARALTCGMITMIDDAVGAVSEDIPMDVVRIFTSDHGDNLGDHRLMFKGSEQYDQVIRVPFIWCDPDLSRESGRSSDIGQTHDIGATILERAGIEAAEGMQGIPLAPVTGGQKREAALIQYEHQVSRGAVGRPRIHTIREDYWRMTILDGVETGELYDLEADPDEMNNLWEDPGASAQKSVLLERLLRLEISHFNRFPLPLGRA